MKKILFQGDSITDSERDRNSETDLGKGYANLVASKIGFENPLKFEFINRGIGGSKAIDIYSRIKCDIINLQPDILSITVGVNDVWQDFVLQNGLSVYKFRQIYSMLIEEVREALPDIKIMLLEPFFMEGTVTRGKMDKFAPIKEMAKTVRELCEKYNLRFITLQDKFDKATELAPPEYWSIDGIHPTCAGHELIKNEWIKAFEEYVEE